MIHKDVVAQPETVFVVENDEPTRQSLSWLLESAGMAVETFESAEAFLGACLTDRPGCLLLDVRLPGMSGVVLQEELARAGIGMPVIVVTGFADVGTAVRVLKHGAFDFLEKPLDSELLVKRVREAVAFDGRRRLACAQREQLCARLARLSARERAVFDQVVQGKANKVVAIEFGISEKTVEAHRARVMHKLGATSIAELVRMDLAANQLDLLRGLPMLPFGGAGLEGHAATGNQASA
jgi:FixJ family two-component response regulator